MELEAIGTIMLASAVAVGIVGAMLGQKEGERTIGERWRPVEMFLAVVAVLSAILIWLGLLGVG